MAQNRSKISRRMLMLAGAGSVATGFSTVRACSASRDTWLQGIDVSHTNDVDWSKAKAAGVSFVFIKSTDGLDYLDPKFIDSLDAARKANLAVGTYHFYRSNDSGADQAAWFIANAPLQKGDLPPVVDIEKMTRSTLGDLHTEFRNFLNIVKQHYGADPIIYTGPNFWNHSMRDQLANNKLWVAQYEVAEPTLPQGWTDWTVWQHTSAMNLACAKEPVDASYFNGGPDDLARLLLS